MVSGMAGGEYILTSAALDMICETDVVNRASMKLETWSFIRHTQSMRAPKTSRQADALEYQQTFALSTSQSPTMSDGPSWLIRNMIQMLLEIQPAGNSCVYKLTQRLLVCISTDLVPILVYERLVVPPVDL